jgi:uncharacterized protein YdhG (YjbR/CyaY superfamily)
MAEKSTTSKKSKSTVWTDEERAAMREAARERKSESRAGKDRAAGEAAVLAKIAEMPKPDRDMAERLHEIVATNAPDLVPRTWYGMPAYANAEGKVVCYFTPAAKFKERYATLGFNADAKLDDGRMWPTSWALTEMTDGEARRIADLVKKAAG